MLLLLAFNWARVEFMDVYKVLRTMTGRADCKFEKLTQEMLKDEDPKLVSELFTYLTLRCLHLALNHVHDSQGNVDVVYENIKKVADDLKESIKNDFLN